MYVHYNWKKLNIPGSELSLSQRRRVTGYPKAILSCTRVISRTKKEGLRPRAKVWPNEYIGRLHEVQPPGA